MTNASLSALYHEYIDCLNDQNWSNLGKFVHDDVHHNGKGLGVSGYRQMLERDFDAIPDLHFNVLLLVAESPLVASRLLFDCTPKRVLFGLPVNGRKVKFSENVFYEFLDGRIRNVWSIIDKAAIEVQLRNS